MGTLLDIVVGTVFVFAVFSLVVSGINELVTAVFAIRSKILWQIIIGLAADTVGDVPKLTIGRVLHLAVTAPWLEKLPLIGKRAKHWVDHRPEATSSAPTNADGFLDGLVARTARFDSATGTKRTRVKYVPAQVVSQVLLELGGNLPALAESGGQVIAQGETFLNQVLAHPTVVGTHLEAPVRTAIARAQGDIDKFRIAMEEWFDTRMAGLSGVYKAWSRWTMFVIALFVAFTANVNPIRTIDALRRDTALAHVTADQAAEFVKTVSPGVDLCAGDPTAVDDQTATAAQQVTDCYKTIQNSIARANELPPPLNFNRDRLFRGSDDWLPYIFGCLLGAIAISFGAPFWFDALRKLIGLRK